jgi:hypothetical protein
MLLWPRLRIITKIPYIVLCLLAGCTPSRGLFDISQQGGSITKSMPPVTSDPMGILSLVGGLAIAGGIVALVISRGGLGIRACVIGLACILINYAVCRYADWIFIPVLIATAAISISYAYRIVRQALLQKKESSNV